MPPDRAFELVNEVSFVRENKNFCGCVLNQEPIDHGAGDDRLPEACRQHHKSGARLLNVVGARLKSVDLLLAQFRRGKAGPAIRVGA